MRYKPGEPDREALDVLARELTDEARGALAHLLNNAICPLLMEAVYFDADRETVREHALRLNDVVRAITRTNKEENHED